MLDLKSFNPISFLKAKNSYFANAPIQEKMRLKLVQILSDYESNGFDLSFDDVFEFGAGQGELTRLLVDKIRFKRYIVNDINDYGIDFTRIHRDIKQMFFDMNEAKKMLCGAQFDLIASNACLQWLPFSSTIENLASLLKPNGVILLSTFGAQNYKEIKELTNISLPYLTAQNLKNELERNFKILELKEEILEMRFEKALDVFRHIKRSGANAFQHRIYLSKNLLERYEKNFKNKLTYHPIYILATRNN